MKKTMFILLALLTIAGIAPAQNNPPVNPNVPVGPRTDSNPNLKPMPGVVMEDLMTKLNLSDAQKGKIDDLMSSHKKMMNTLDAEIENLRIDLVQAIKKDDFVNARKITLQISQKMLARDNARLDFLEAVLKELKPEQKDIFRSNFLDMMPNGGMCGMCGMGGMNGMGNMRMGMMHGQGGMMDNCPDCDKDKTPDTPMPPKVDQKGTNTPK